MQYFKGNSYRDESAFKENPFHNSIFFFFFVMGWNYTSEITRKNKRLTKGQSQEERERQSPDFIDPHSTNNFL